MQNQSWKTVLQASAPRAPPDMDDLVLELDAASISSTDQAAEPQDFTCVDIDTFLVGF